MAKKIVFTVTSDLSYDQRMIRICTSLAAAGYQVMLIGTQKKDSIPLIQQPFQQKRLRRIFKNGKLFYAGFNLRLFFYLLFIKADAICAIDLDTVLPCLFISRIKGIPRIYDAHELFCEMKEIVERRSIYHIWKRIEQYAIPRFPLGYTVNEPIASEFFKLYGHRYAVIRNIALLQDFTPVPKSSKFILYQGAINEGRCFEMLIPAMQWVRAPLVLCGTGNFLDQTKALVEQYQVKDKVIFKGAVAPQELLNITRAASIGITLFESNSINNYYSLANRFFDYIQAGIPQLCVDYPAYRDLNNLFEVAVLIQEPGPEGLAEKLNELLENQVLYNKLAANCLSARTQVCWQEESKKLVQFYKSILS